MSRGVYVSAQGREVLSMSDPAYGITRHLDVDYAEGERLAKEALKEQGFGILTEINVRDTIKEKLGEDFRPYLILGACNPKLAHRAISAEPDIGLMLPCNVVVYEEGPNKTCVEAISPQAALGVVDNDELGEVAEEVEAKLTAAMDTVAQKAGSH